MNRLTHFDLFSGIGGFALSAKWAGFETVGFSEIDPFCCKVLAKNFPGIKNYGDINNIRFPVAGNDPNLIDIKLITAGFPCQPFSQAGNKRGLNDKRYLWPHLRRFIQQSQPDWIIIENVCGIIPMVLDDIITDLAIEGYIASVFVLPACAANAPHRRDRLWIVAHYYSIGNEQWLSDRPSRQIQENINRHMAQIQSQWTQLKPDTWSTYTARDWLDYNTRASRGNDGVSVRLDRDRIKALGNAIVPQVIYPIMEFIKLISNSGFKNE